MIQKIKEKFPQLTLKGNFSLGAFALKAFRFTYAFPLLHQSFVPPEPRSRVLLDEGILWEVLAVSPTEIKVQLNSQVIVDLYLKGLHKLSLEHGGFYTDVLIQVGEPVPR